MPIRVVTREVRYIHELSLTLEYSMPISSPAAPGLTGYTYYQSEGMKKESKDSLEVVQQPNECTSIWLSKALNILLSVI